MRALVFKWQQALALRAFLGHSCREARYPSLWAVCRALKHCSQFVGAAGSLHRAV